MGFFMTKFFWGTLLIGWGVMMILEKLLKMNIPYGRFIFAFILIYAGIYIITKHTSHKKIIIEKKFNKSETVCERENVKEYNLTFGENVIDLSEQTDYSKLIKINTVFGQTDVYLSANEIYDIKVNTVLGETLMPTDKTINFGTNHFKIGDSEKDEKVNVEINTVFGTTNVLVK